MKANLLHTFNEDEWHTWAPTNAQTANFKRKSDALCISIDKGTFQYGKWICEKKVIANKTYYFSIDYTCVDTFDENMSVSAILTWKKTQGETQELLMRNYADEICEDKNFKTLHTTILAPKDADTLYIELALKWQGKVEFKNPVLKIVDDVKPQYIKIATCYIKPENEEQKNLSKILSTLDNAAKQNPDIICFAETLFCRNCNLPLNNSADFIPGKYTKIMCDKAREHNVFVFFSMHEKDDLYFYNTAVLIDNKGKIIGKYRKTHLALIECEKGIVPGNEYPVFDTALGKIGMLICWDSYFTQPISELRKKGAQIVLVSTAGDIGYRSVARAMDNGLYLVISGVNFPNEKGLKASRIIGPQGDILAQTQEDMQCAIAKINLSERKYTYWLSVGAGYGEARSIYMKEKIEIDGLPL